MNPREIGRLIQPWIAGQNVEHAFVLLAEKRGPAAIVRVAIGNPHTVDIALPEVFRVPQAIGARSMTLAHSHPSGRLFVSDLDMELTRRIVEACASNGLQLDDHVIVNDRGEALSMVECGALIVPPQSLLTAAGIPQ